MFGWIFSLLVGVAQAATSTIPLNFVAAGPPPANVITFTNQGATPLVNYPFQFGRPFLQGAILTGQCVEADWNVVGGTAAGLTTQSDVKNSYPDGSVEFAVVAVVIPNLPVGGVGTLTLRPGTCAQPAPLTLAQMEAMLPAGAVILTLNNTATPPVAYSTIDANQMLQDGSCAAWTQGPEAQTMICADDSPLRKYDIGFGDGFHPVRPRFYLTFWPTTNQVQVRTVVENGLTTEIEDAAYVSEISLNGVVAYQGDLSGTQATNPKVHWAGSRWSKTFWLGGTPPTQINIDNNLAYLESTRFLPNFDTSIVVSQSNLATEYSRYSQNTNDIYDGSWNQPTGSTTWQSAMPSTGARQDIAPYPEWTTLWLYTGDWRMRQVALGLADQAASWPLHIREIDPTKRFLLSDPVPASGTVGTGFGKVFSRVDRQSTFGGLALNGNGLFNWGTVKTDNLKAVSTSVDKNSPWGADGAHQPQAFYPQYILTGDYFYLEEMNFWAGIMAFGCWGGTNTLGQGCGPWLASLVTQTSYNGAIHDQLRGDAWVLRNRAETAFAEPDGSVEKIYFQALTDEAIARWEGGFQLLGTKFDGTPEKVWGQKVGNEQTTNAGKFTGQVPPLHEWGSICDPALAFSACINDATWLNPTTGGFSDPWMQWYVMYSIGRAAELGFPIQAINSWSTVYPISLILDSGNPFLTGFYEDGPLGSGTTGWETTWPEWIGNLNLSPTCCGGLGFYPVYWNENLASDGREVWLTPGLAMTVDQGQPRALTAWNWWLTNVYSKVPDFPNDPKWAVVPRTDNNVLPAQP